MTVCSAVPAYFHYTDADNRERARVKDKTKKKETKFIAEEKKTKKSQLHRWESDKC